MAYDEELLRRLRGLLAGRGGIEERKMFGVACFFLNGNMLCGAEVGRYLFRVGKAQEADSLRQPGATPMESAGRPMGGFVHVAASACEGNGLRHWLDRAVRYVGELPAKKVEKKK